jgi:hypothetical protein
MKEIKLSSSIKGFKLYNLFLIQSLFSQTSEEKRRRTITYNNKKVVFVRRNFDSDYYYVNVLEIPEELKGLIIYKNNIILNYPKIHNTTRLDSNFIYQEKYNGTNLGLFKLNNQIFYRTRGLLKPSDVYNEIMFSIANNKDVIIPFSKAETEKIKGRFKPVFETCLKKEYLKETGHLDMNNIVNHILSNYGDEIEEMLNNYNILFGELISACNPIIVDFELKRGLYNNIDPDFILFDVGYVDDKGDYYLIYDFETKKMKRAKLYTATNLPDDIEGFVLKSNHGYFKYKPEDVLRYERVVSQLESNPYDYFNMVIRKLYQEGSLFIPTSEEELKLLISRVKEETFTEGFDDIITEVLYVYIIHSYLKTYGGIDRGIVEKMRNEIYIPFGKKKLGKLIGKALKLLEESNRTK